MDSQPSESTAIGNKKKLSEKVHRSNSTLYAHLIARYMHIYMDSDYLIQYSLSHINSYLSKGYK